MAKKHKIRLVTKRQLQLHKYGSPDDTRTALQVVHFDGNKASVTDGHKLIQCTDRTGLDPSEYPVKWTNPKAPEGPFSISKEDAKSALDFLPKKSPNHILANYVAVSTCDDGYKMQAGEPPKQAVSFKVEGKFPNVEKLVADHADKPRIRVGLNAQYLKDICEYILQGKEKGRSTCLTLELETENAHQNPVKIICDEADHLIEALIMPIRT